MFSKNIDVIVKVTVGLIIGIGASTCGFILCKCFIDCNKYKKQIRAINTMATVVKVMGDAVDKLPVKEDKE